MSLHLQTNYVRNQKYHIPSQDIMKKRCFLLCFFVKYDETNQKREATLDSISKGRRVIREIPCLFKRGILDTFFFIFMLCNFNSLKHLDKLYFFFNKICGIAKVKTQLHQYNNLRVKLFPCLSGGSRNSLKHLL